MCDGNKPTLKFIFKELQRKTTPCVNFDKDSADRTNLGRALRLAVRNCVRFDGCCSSRVRVKLETLNKILTKDGPCATALEQSLKDYLGCPATNCCDD